MTDVAGELPPLLAADPGRRAAPSRTSTCGDRACRRCSSISPDGSCASNAHAAAHRLDQPEARPRRAGADVRAADRLLFDLRQRLRRPGGDPTPRVSVAVVDEDRSEFSRRWSPRCGRRTRCGSASTAPNGAALDRAGGRALVRNGDVPVAIVMPKGIGDELRALGFDASGRRSSCSPIRPIRSRRRWSGPAAESGDDRGARLDDAGRDEAVREARRRADAGTAQGRR